jgi:hypothetical protein
MANVNSVTTSNSAAGAKPISIYFGARAKRENFSSYSRAVLTSIMKVAAVHTV